MTTEKIRRIKRQTILQGVVLHSGQFVFSRVHTKLFRIVEIVSERGLDVPRIDAAVEPNAILILNDGATAYSDQVFAL